MNHCRFGRKTVMYRWCKEKAWTVLFYRWHRCIIISKMIAKKNPNYRIVYVLFCYLLFQSHMPLHIYSSSHFFISFQMFCSHIKRTASLRFKWKAYNINSLRMFGWKKKPGHLNEMCLFCRTTRIKRNCAKWYLPICLYFVYFYNEIASRMIGSLVFVV